MPLTFAFNLLTCAFPLSGTKFRFDPKPFSLVFGRITNSTFYERNH